MALFAQGANRIPKQARIRLTRSFSVIEAACVLLVLAVLVLSPLAVAETGAPAYEADLAAFFEEVDATYPFFELKGIREEWNATKQRLSGEVTHCESDSEFLGLVVEAIRSLHDSHIWISNNRAEIPPIPTRYYPGIGFMPASENRVVVMSAMERYADKLKTGTIITKIDGKNACQFLEEAAKEAWEEGFNSSPQRSRLYAYRIPFRGEEGATHTLTYLADGEETELEVTCDMEARGWPHVYNMPADLVRVGRSSFYTRLPSGAGYIYLRRVDGSAEPGIREALEKHPDAKGWIVDLRGNGGGGYGIELIKRIQAIPKPVAVLIDAGCMSAGETLARDLAQGCGARLFGQRTAGSSSAKRSWTFPSGIASVTLPTRSRWRHDGEPIEYNGIVPDVEVEPVPEEVQAGKNSCILRAEEWLAEATVR